VGAGLVDVGVGFLGAGAVAAELADDFGAGEGADVAFGAAEGADVAFGAADVADVAFGAVEGADVASPTDARPTGAEGAGLVRVWDAMVASPDPVSSGVSGGSAAGTAATPEVSGEGDRRAALRARRFTAAWVTATVMAEPARPARTA
jgi:hypothetical protein